MSRPALYPAWTWWTWAAGVPLLLIAVGFASVIMTDADTVLFDGAEYWWLGVAGPVAGLVVLYGVARRRRALERFTSPDLAPLLAARIMPSRQALRAGMIIAAVLMIVAGVIGPRWGIYLEKQKVHGVDIVVALDVSRSMLARDVEPHRLARAVREVRQQLVERAVFGRTNRLALLTFAGSTSLKLPLTTDHQSFSSKLDAVYVGSAPRGGTAIAEAIQRASDLCARSPREATKVILLLTDGEDHEGDPIEAARVAYEEQGIRTFTVGVGDPARTVGAEVPVDGTRRAKPLLHNGQIVISRLDVDGLRRIARAGGGDFAPITQLHRLVDAMAGMRKTLLTAEERIRHRPQYQWFVAVALILLIVETMISDRRVSVADLPVRLWQQEAA